jgi:hypothetical protein
MMKKNKKKEVKKDEINISLVSCVYFNKTSSEDCRKILFKNGFLMKVDANTFNKIAYKLGVMSNE